MTDQKLKRAEEEAEYYRREVEDLRQRERERDDRLRDERERKRKEERRANDPSNRLYNNSVGEFREAVQCRVACCRREIVPLDGNFDELTEKCNQAMRDAISEANRALEIYDNVFKRVKLEAISEMRGAGLLAWAEALETDDYSQMAI